jgi:hypothetical protein
MNFFRTATLSLLLGIGSVAAARGEEPIRSWPAPLLWSPGSASTAADQVPDRGSRHPESAASLPTPPLPLIGITPCRIADTRGNGFSGSYGPPSLAQGTPRDFTLTGQCGIAGTAAAVSLNVTVTNTQGPGFLLIYPQGGTQPLVSTLNYLGGQTVANAAVVPVGPGGAITVVAGVSGSDLIIDTNGYYDASGLITAITPGTGLSGGGTSGNVTLGISNGGVNTAQLADGGVTSPKLNTSVFAGTGVAATAARSDHNHDLSYWKTTGNSGSGSANFLGTTDNQPFEIRVNGTRALRIEPTSSTPNIIGGYSGNNVTPGFEGATIVGGGLPGNLNTVTNGNGTVVGGYGNRADQGGFVGGGSGNQALGVNSTVGGGGANVAGGAGSTIPGGDSNSALGNTSFAAGYNAQAMHFGAFVWGDFSILSPVTSTGPNQFIVRAAGGARFLRETTTHTGTSAALQAEHAGALGEGAWVYTSSSSNPSAVIKLLKNPSGTNNFLNCENFGVATKCHITSAGTFVAGSDFAESLPAAGGRGAYEPGDVLVASRELPGGVEKSSVRSDPRAIGVYSTRPGFVGADKDGDTRIDPDEIPVAITGIVPTKVTSENGPIDPGDLLTTSSTPGYAMKATPALVGGFPVYPAGTLLGKALGSLRGERGVIKMLVLPR